MPIKSRNEGTNIFEGVASTIHPSLPVLATFEIAIIDVTPAARTLATLNVAAQLEIESKI